jgi:hypothetical protein
VPTLLRRKKRQSICISHAQGDLSEIGPHCRNLALGGTRDKHHRAKTHRDAAQWSLPSPGLEGFSVP